MRANWFAAHCVTDPDFRRRERIIIIYSVVSDIVTDAMSKSSHPFFSLCLTQDSSRFHSLFSPSPNPSQDSPKGQHRHSPMPQHGHDCNRSSPRNFHWSLRNSRSDLVFLLGSTGDLYQRHNGQHHDLQNFIFCQKGHHKRPELPTLSSPLVEEEAAATVA